MIPFSSPIHKALYATDEAFSERGRAIYGKRWGDMRYQSAPFSDPLLESLATAYRELSRVYNLACTEARALPTRKGDSK